MKPSYWERYKEMYGEKAMLYRFHLWLKNTIKRRIKRKKGSKGVQLKI